MTQPVILGIDEVGRGPWAGPLVIGAVILGADFPEIGLNDSKKLTAKKRQELNQIILKQAAAHATGWVSAAEIDQYGLSAALKLATRRAVKQILAQKTFFSEIIIDGTINFLQNTPLENRVTVLKKADALIQEVSAASIIAKVARDDYMTKIALQYPVYNFEKHVGYGTAMHKNALLEFGPCPEHRRSFRPIRELIDSTDSSEPKSLSSGQIAEQTVAQYLKNHDHRILEQNYKTKSYEIDLISVQNNQLFFTEVKYSQRLATEGTPLVRITKTKQQQMQYAANAFLATHKSCSSYRPILAVASVAGDNFQVTDWFTLED